MAEDDTPKRFEEDDDTPQIAVPSHSPLPPPPEIHYTRPTLGQRESAKPSQPSSDRSSLGSWSDASKTVSHGAGLAAGVTFGASIVAGAMLGNWIDHRWNHTGTPWATLIMTLIGTAAGFINLKRLLARTNRDQK